MKLREVTYEHYLPSKRKTSRGNTVQCYESSIMCYNPLGIAPK